MDLKLYQQFKKEGFNIRTRKDLKIKPNNNSSDYVVPPLITGCGFNCLYCYVSRHNKFGNPITQYDNVDEILEAVIEHSNRVGKKKTPNQQDSVFTVYELMEDTDLFSPQNIDIANYAINRLIMDGYYIKPTMATKGSNKHTIKKLIDCPIKRQARIRVSLMPQRISNILEPGTSLIKDRIDSISYLYSKGYEVHINWAPVIMYNSWLQDYLELFQQVDSYLDSLNTDLQNEIKNQLACEIIFLTHHPKLHQSNLEWAGEEESILWQPENQEFKTNKRGASDILRYRLDIKKPALQVLFGALKKHMPYCRVRYAF